MAGSTGQQYQQPAIDVCQFRLLDLPFEYDELLSQKCIFSNQRRLAFKQVADCTCSQGLGYRFGPLFQFVFNSINYRLNELQDPIQDFWQQYLIFSPRHQQFRLVADDTGFEHKIRPD